MGHKGILTVALLHKLKSNHVCIVQAVKFVLLLSRQGKVRLSKWYTTYTQKDRAKIIRDITPLVLGRALKLCNFLDYQDIKVSPCTCSLEQLFRCCPLNIRFHRTEQGRCSLVDGWFSCCRDMKFPV